MPDTAEWEGKEVTLTLNEFITHWELYQEKYYPRDWISDVSVDVIGHGPEVLWPNRIVEVNRPLRAGGLTFYQMAYEQEFDVVVWQGGSEVERVRANAYAPFTLESIEGTFSPGNMRVGTLYQKYLPTEPVVPHVSLKWQPPEPPVDETVVEAVVEEPAPEEPPAATDAAELTEGEVDSTGMAVVEADSVIAPPPPPPPERIELGDLSAGEPLEVEGFTLTLENPYEGSVLSYRHDPGVALIYIAIAAFMIGLGIRTYWPSYRVSLWIEETDNGALGKLVLRATGMLGEPRVIEDELVEELGGDAGVSGSETPDDAPAGEEPPAEPWTQGTEPLRDALPDVPPDAPPDGPPTYGKEPLRDALPDAPTDPDESEPML